METIGSCNIIKEEDLHNSTKKLNEYTNGDISPEIRHLNSKIKGFHNRSITLDEPDLLMRKKFKDNSKTFRVRNETV